MRLTDEQRKELEQEMDDLILVGLVANLKGDENAPKPAALTASMAWRDGKGQKFKDDREKNEYEQHTRRKMAGRDRPELDMEGDDPATQ